MIEVKAEAKEEHSAIEPTHFAQGQTPNIKQFAMI
jgi:hypothetical protein